MTLQPDTKYRGAQMGEKTPESLIALLANGVNIVRYQLVTGWDNSALKAPDTYRVWLDSQLALLDATLAVQPSNVYGVLDLHTPPGGNSINGKTYALFSNEPSEVWTVKCFFETWKYLVSRYDKNPKIKVYGILNEPSASSDMMVEVIMQTTAAGIRKLGSQKIIAVTGRYSSLDAMKTLGNITDPKLWYEFHMYEPLPFTHQGLASFPLNQVYPSTQYPRAALFARLKMVRDAQVKYNMQTIFVGEFSCNQFADVESRYRYLTDLTGRFEAFGWNYCYHAWREAAVWNMEKDPKIFTLLKNRWGLN